VPKIHIYTQKGTD